MQKLSDHLGLSFSITLNRGKRQEKDRYISEFMYSPLSSCSKWQSELIGLEVSGVDYLQVTATSDRLLRVCLLVDFLQLPLATWEIISMASQGTGPLRLLQHRIAPGVSFIVGTLAETLIDVDDIDLKEQALLIVLSIHLNTLLWKLLDLGEGPTSHAVRRLLRDDLDPHYVLHYWHVSVQFYIFGRNIWAQTFKQVFW